MSNQSRRTLSALAVHDAARRDQRGLRLKISKAGQGDTSRRHLEKHHAPLSDRRSRQRNARCKVISDPALTGPLRSTPGCVALPGRTLLPDTYRALPSPVWFLRRQQQARPRFVNGSEDGSFSIDVFHEYLAASTLKDKVRNTLHEVLYSADVFGRTTVSGRWLAAKLGTREATISAHLKKAREAGFLLTRYRFNNSSVQQLTWPGSSIHPPEPGVSPLTNRIWSDGEVAWWTSLTTEWPLPPPWGVGEPPF